MKRIYYSIAVILSMHYACTSDAAYKDNQQEPDILQSLMDFETLDILRVPKSRINKKKTNRHNFNDAAFQIHAARFSDITLLHQYMPYGKSWPKPRAPEQEPALCPAWQERLNPLPRPHVWGSRYAWEQQEEEGGEAQHSKEKKRKTEKPQQQIITHQKQQAIEVKTTIAKSQVSHQCTLCPKISDSIPLLAQHIIRAHWIHSQGLPKNNQLQCQRPYQCEKCARRFNNHISANEHVKGSCKSYMTTNEEVRQAALQYAFTMTSEDSQGLIKFGDLSCQLATLKHPAKTQKNKHVSPSSYSFACELCSIQYSTLNMLGLHIVRSHWSSEEGLPSDDALQCHIPYECLGCKSRFQQSGQANLHSRHKCQSGVQIPEGVLIKARALAQKMNPTITSPISCTENNAILFQKSA